MGETVVLLQLFVTFLMIGFVSFGGGYAMIPIIEKQVVDHYGWMSIKDFTDVIAIAGMSPGPIATNSAIFIGYQTAGFPGAVVSTLGMVLPSLLIVLLTAALFTKVHKNKLIQSAFYGLRPIITGLIIYAAIIFAVKNNMIGEFSWYMVGLMFIYLFSLFALMRLKLHPVYVILLSGMCGMAFYG